MPSGLIISKEKLIISRKIATVDYVIIEKKQFYNIK